MSQPLTRAVTPGVYAESDILRAWRLTDPRDDKTRIANSKDPLLDGSCSWIFDDPAFTRWWNDDECRILWIHGDPGKGKTMMMMAIVDEISRRVKSEPGLGMLSYFFCQSTIQGLSSANAIVRGLAFLLSAQNSRLTCHLRKKYEEAGDGLFEGANSLFSMWTTFIELLQDAAVRRYYLMVDALDECDSTSTETFLRLLTQGVPDLPKAKWIVTSRNEPRIVKHLRDARQSHDTSLELNSSHVARAVRSFIDFKVGELARQMKYNSELEGYIRGYLDDHADGTFLWVSLVCKELEKVKSRRAREACATFPAGLDPLYQRMMEQMQREDDCKEMLQVLRTMTVACRPLNLSEVGVIANLPEDLSSDTQDLLDLIASCGSFLTVRDRTIDFVHKSAKDYFTDGGGSTIFPSGQARAQHEMANRLLNIMSRWLKRDVCHLGIIGMTREQVDVSCVEKYLPQYVWYACSFWVEHIKRGESQLKVYDQVHKFLREHFLHWLEALGLIGKVADSIPMLSDLQRMLKVSS